MECPSNKTCHQTKQQAMKQIRSSEKRGNITKLHPYKCPDCGWFHVTSQLANRKGLIIK